MRRRANIMQALRSSGSKSGISARIWDASSPDANKSRTSLTRIRIPRTQGRPPHCLGFTVIRSIKFCISANTMHPTSRDVKVQWLLQPSGKSAFFSIPWAGLPKNHGRRFPRPASQRGAENSQFVWRRQYSVTGQAEWRWLGLSPWPPAIPGNWLAAQSDRRLWWNG